MICTVFMLMNACAPSRHVHGNTPDPDVISSLEIGTSSKEDVIRSIGSPSAKAAFNENIWYYIGLETVKQGFLDPKVENKIIYTAKFDENNVLSALEVNDSGMTEIPIAEDVTPTHGTELTVLEQFVGNIGRFNSAGGVQSSSPTGGPSGQ